MAAAPEPGTQMMTAMAAAPEPGAETTTTMAAAPEPGTETTTMGAAAPEPGTETTTMGAAGAATGAAAGDAPTAASFDLLNAELELRTAQRDAVQRRFNAQSQGLEDAQVERGFFKTLSSCCCLVGVSASIACFAIVVMCVTGNSICPGIEFLHSMSKCGENQTLALPQDSVTGSLH